MAEKEKRWVAVKLQDCADERWIGFAVWDRVGKTFYPLRWDRQAAQEMAERLNLEEGRQT